jgi:FkbM family methyltransferase
MTMVSGHAFWEGDVVVDIGAHVGLFAIYLAKRYPLEAACFEPFPQTRNCVENLQLNRITIVPRPRR